MTLQALGSGAIHQRVCQFRLFHDLRAASSLARSTDIAAAPNFAAKSSRSVCERDMAMIRAPRRVSSSTQARPIPLPAPVMDRFFCKV